MKTTSIVALAMLATMDLSFIPNLTTADTSVQQTWVRMRGLINQWGSTPVMGWINAHARMVDANETAREWVGVRARRIPFRDSRHR